MNPGKFLLYGSLLSLIACGPSTKITKSWTDPSFTPSTAQSFNKILVMGLLKDESTRRIAEDKMVKAFKSVTAVPSYSYLQPADSIESVVEDKLKKDGFDGVVIMRLADVDKSVSYVPGQVMEGGMVTAILRRAITRKTEHFTWKQIFILFRQINCYGQERHLR